MFRPIIIILLSLIHAQFMEVDEAVLSNVKGEKIQFEFGDVFFTPHRKPLRHLLVSQTCTQGRILAN